MSQFITVKVKMFNKYAIMINSIISVAEEFNGAVFVNTNDNHSIEVEDMFEDIINQLKGQ
jgi:hypothetical protein